MYIRVMEQVSRMLPIRDEPAKTPQTPARATPAARNFRLMMNERDERLKEEQLSLNCCRVELRIVSASGVTEDPCTPQTSAFLGSIPVSRISRIETELTVTFGNDHIMHARCIR